MKVISKITAGFRSDGSPEPLIRIGEWDFEGRRLSTQERALVHALADAHALEIVEDDEPLADVVPIAPARAKHEKRIAQVVASVAPPAESQPRRRATKKRVSRSR